MVGRKSTARATGTAKVDQRVEALSRPMWSLEEGTRVLQL